MSCDCGCSCNCNTVIQKGDIGPQGPQGIQGIQGEQGEQGEPGANYTETNFFYKNVGYSPDVTIESSPVTDPELVVTIADDGKYLVTYSGICYMPNDLGDTAFSVYLELHVNGSAVESKIYAITQDTVNISLFSIDATLNSLQDLTNGDVLEIVYDRINNPGSANHKFNFKGNLTVIRIA